METSIKQANTKVGFVISKEDITNILSHLIGIVEKRNTIPQLANIKIESTGNSQVKFTTTDMDISIIETMELPGFDTVGFTLPAITLYDIVKKFPAKSLIKFQMHKHNIEITADGVFFALPFLDIHDFPAIEQEDFTSSFSLSTDEFTKLFSKTKFAISTEESRYSLTTLLLHTHNDELRATTTDCHRLALTSMKRDEISPFSILISRKTVLELVKLFEKIKGVIKVFISDNKVQFTCNNVVLISKLVAAKFPDYQKILPTKYEKIITVNKEALTMAVDRVSAIYIDKAKSVRLSFQDKVLKVSTSNSDSSNAHEILHTDYEEETFEICFNYSYLLEMLYHVDHEEIKIHCNNSQSAAMITNANTIYIIMPMSV